MIEAFWRDLTASPVGLIRMAAGREDWRASFDASTGGFVRSFAALVPALVLSLSVDGPLLLAIGGQAPTAAQSWASAAGFAIHTVLYPVLVGLLVSRLGGAAGFGLFVTALNWLRLWLHAALAVVGVAAAAGLPQAVVVTGWITVAAAMFYLLWRLARETLTGEVGLSLAVVMLALGSETAADYLAAWLVGVFG